VKFSSADLLKNAINSGYDAILPWVWKAETMDVDAVTTCVGLPAMLYRVEAIRDNEVEECLRPLTLSPDSTSVTGSQWIEYSSGSVTFIPETENATTIYYSAMWTKLDEEDDVAEPPGYSHMGILCYAASTVLMASATNAADIRQYATRVDSGTPEDNPLKIMSDAFYKRFEIEMSRMPMMVRGAR
jgi:hypothetical protein